eukprot:752542-Hanusia_phi.AAC.6
MILDTFNDLEINLFSTFNNLALLRIHLSTLETGFPLLVFSIRFAPLTPSFLPLPCRTTEFALPPFLLLVVGRGVARPRLRASDSEAGRALGIPSHWAGASPAVEPASHRWA